MEEAGPAGAVVADRRRRSAEAEAALADGEHQRCRRSSGPAFTLGGHGGGVGNTETELAQVVSEGLAASPINQVLVEESVLGWGEFELEVMRDRNDNVVIICSIENVDPMGVHTGDSVTVAPAQTLTDALYQELRDQAIRVIRAVGVETGGSNIQFAVNPETGEIVVIEMNPRVSRSSALASKATGFPIAKIAAKLAVGYALEEIPNDITRRTPASFEPTIDYVVTKVPRFAFEKFPGAEGRLTTHMKSVGEAMAIGRTFRESFAKAMRSRELDSEPRASRTSTGELLERLATPVAGPLRPDARGVRRGVELERIQEATMIDPWFLRELRDAGHRGRRHRGPRAHLRSVDTCAAEFEARTPYFYSAHERRAPMRRRRGASAGDRAVGRDPRLRAEPDRPGDRVRLLLRARGDDRPRVGPRRGDDQLQPGDGLDRLRHLRPPLLRAAHRGGRARGVEVEQPEGVIVQFGGQTPLRLAEALEEAGVPLLGTPVDAIDLAEDRGRFGALLRRLEIAHPPYGTALSAEEAVGDRRGRRLPAAGPALLRARRPGDGDLLLDARPSAAYLEANVKADQEHPLLLDRFLENAIEVDVDALCRRRATASSPGSCSTSRRPASTPATRPA